MVSLRKIFNCLHMIQMVERNKESCEEQKLEALQNGSSCLQKKTRLCPVNNWAMNTMISTGSHSVNHSWGNYHRHFHAKFMWSSYKEKLDPGFQSCPLMLLRVLLVGSNLNKLNITKSWAVLYNCWAVLLKTKHSLNDTSMRDCCYLEVDTVLALVLWWEQSVIAIKLTGILEVCLSNRLQDQNHLQLSCKLAVGRMSQHSIWKPLRHSTFPSETWWEHSI